MYYFLPVVPFFILILSIFIERHRIRNWFQQVYPDDTGRPKLSTLSEEGKLPFRVYLPSAMLYGLAIVICAAIVLIYHGVHSVNVNTLALVALFAIGPIQAWSFGRFFWVYQYSHIRAKAENERNSTSSRT